MSLSEAPRFYEAKYDCELSIGRSGVRCDTHDRPYPCPAPIRPYEPTRSVPLSHLTPRRDWRNR